MINIATDWWMFGATIGAGLLTTIATIAAVYYTNKWTSERYEQDKIYQNKKNNLVIIKPVLRFCSFSKIIDEMITYNMRERILVVSSEKDGFDFYDDDNKLYSLTHRVFCIKMKHNIKYIR